MASQNKTSPISYMILSVHDYEFHVNNPTDHKITGVIDLSKVSVQYRWRSNLDKENKIFRLILSIFFMYKIDGNNSVTLVNYFNSTNFGILNFDQIVTNFEDPPSNFPNEALASFFKHLHFYLKRDSN